MVTMDIPMTIVAMEVERAALIMATELIMVPELIMVQESQGIQVLLHVFPQLIPVLLNQYLREIFPT